jgi:acyl carrier protein
LINEAGIFLHKKQRGYHNYAFPYSWDVRIGHKTREAALEELNDTIDPASVQQMLDEIGYTDDTATGDPSADSAEPRLVAYYTGPDGLTASDLRAHLAQRVPAAMIPSHYLRLDRLPLTPNGKIDRSALPAPEAQRPTLTTAFVAPRTSIEAHVAAVWAEVLQLDAVGVTDDFLDLGGHSLLAIQIIARINRDFDLDLTIQSAFEAATVAALAALVEDALLRQIEALPEEEAERLAKEASE